MNNIQEEKIKDFMQERKHLVWWVDDLGVLGVDSVVEAVLNHGDWDDVQELIAILGIHKTAEIFWKNSQ